MPAEIHAEPDRTRTLPEAEDAPWTNGAVSVGNTVSAGSAAGDPGAAATGPSGRGRPRRELLRGLFTLGVVAGTAAAPAPVLRAGRESVGAAAGSGARSAEAGAGGVLDEMYRGRHIQIGRSGTAYPGSLAAVSAGPDVSALSPPSPPDIRIDGRPLQVMRRADGSYLSMVNHYESYPTPLAAARAAVRDLRGAQLALDGPVHHI
ncbi:tyrosinase family oxidase copper chaperone [Streptomyces sp. NPDC059883]|uniref:tyrosinase family oxidase copper chaperone n=1 Tax=unclassified Streptomyces TaxID=2593676 RepID=UPI00365F3046